jgi:hypothetical protein
MNPHHRTAQRRKNEPLNRNELYYESLDNLTPADVYFSRARKILSNRDKKNRR